MDTIPPIAPQNLKGLRALASVTDKSGLAKLKRLADAGMEIVSTGGTATALRTKHETPCTEVSDVTEFPEMLDGRLKTLHPKIQGGLLGDTSQPSQLQELLKNNIKPFHVVFINLYDFKGAPGIENIDIGGPTGLRGAAKNGLIVVIDVEDYDRVIDAMLANDGIISESLRDELVIKVFDMTHKYDEAIWKWMKREKRSHRPLFERPLASKKNRVTDPEPPSVLATVAPSEEELQPAVHTGTPVYPRSGN